MSIYTGLALDVMKKKIDELASEVNIAVDTNQQWKAKKLRERYVVLYTEYNRLVAEYNGTNRDVIIGEV